jgi:hypothetical protein
MTKRSYSLCSLGLLLGLGLSGVQLNAQQPADPVTLAAAGQQTAPDSQAQSQQTQVQTFAGTIVKAGDKYDAAGCQRTSFDVDRQDWSSRTKTESSHQWHARR